MEYKFCLKFSPHYSDERCLLVVFQNEKEKYFGKEDLMSIIPFLATSSLFIIKL
jgi:hypothetical protein